VSSFLLCLLGWSYDHFSCLYDNELIYTNVSFPYHFNISRFVAFKYRVNTTVRAIAERTGHSRDTVIDRMNTGEMDFATSQVVQSSITTTTTPTVMKKSQRRDSMTGVSKNSRSREMYF